MHLSFTSIFGCAIKILKPLLPIMYFDVINVAVICFRAHIQIIRSLLHGLLQVMLSLALSLFPPLLPVESGQEVLAQSDKTPPLMPPRGEGEKARGG